MIAPADISAVAAALVLEPGLRGPTYELTGPGAVTLPQIAATLTGLLGREITYTATTPEVMREAMAARGVPGYYAKVALGIDRSVEAGLPRAGHRHRPELLGRPATDAATVLATHLAACTGAA